MNKDKDNQTFHLKISKDGLKTIMSALECYARLGINQFKYCLEHNPDFSKLDYDAQKEIEDYILIRTKTADKHYGIYHPQVASFNDAFQIKKEIELYVSLSECGGVAEGCTKSFDGADPNHPNIPKFTDEKGNSIYWEKRFPIPKKIQTKIKKFTLKDKFKEMWDCLGKNMDLGGIHGNSTRVSDDFKELVVSKPYKINVDKSV